MASILSSRRRRIHVSSLQGRTWRNPRRRHGSRKYVNPSPPLVLVTSIIIRGVETVQVIAFLTCVFGKRGNSTDRKRMRYARDRGLAYPRVLIICPGSVMSNWERELNTVKPHTWCYDGDELISLVGVVAYFIVSWTE